jgi:hypothetical protein
MNVISEKKNRCAINFKLSSHIQGNTISNLTVMFLRLIISVMGCHCDYWPRVPKKKTGYATAYSYSNEPSDSVIARNCLLLEY